MNCVVTVISYHIGEGHWMPLFYSATLPPYLIDLLSLRLVRQAGARKYVRSYLILTAGPQNEPSNLLILTQVL